MNCKPMIKFKSHCFPISSELDFAPVLDALGLLRSLRASVVHRMTVPWRNIRARGLTRDSGIAWESLMRELILSGVTCDLCLGHSL